jgi:hypothetical protein
VGAKRGRTSAGTVIAVPFVIAFGVAFAMLGSKGSAASYPSGDCSGPPVAAGRIVDGQLLGPAQIGNAQLIYNVGTALGLPRQAAVIAIATAMQESKLENISYGTSDSLGLFQQRPSQGWGSPAQIMEPVYAASAFYSRLAVVPGWQGLPLTVAAQDVQHSAYPGAYAQWQPLATSLADSFTGMIATCVTSTNLSSAG